MVCAFAFPKRFKGTTVITGDSGLFNILPVGDISMDRVKLESPDFESA